MSIGILCKLECCNVLAEDLQYRLFVKEEGSLTCFNVVDLFI